MSKEPIANYAADVMIESLNKLRLLIFNKRFSWLILLGCILIFNISLIVFKANDSFLYTPSISKLLFILNAILASAFIYSVYLKYPKFAGLSLTPPIQITLFTMAWIARIALSRLGHNYDFESFEIVSDHILQGQNFYKETSRYNYGPVWAYLCAGMKYLSSIGGGYNPVLFHSYMASLLFVFELLLLKTLNQSGYNQFSLLIGLFNPISLILIGHHSQFDVMALALGFISIRQLQNGRVLQACLLLGLSLSIKHILAFLPLLFLFRSDLSLSTKIKFLVLPPLIFAIGFLPFISAWPEIKTNVIGYQLNHGQTLIYKLGELLFPNFLTDFESLKNVPFGSSYKPLWLGLIIAIGYKARHRNLLELILIYLLTILAFSPAISEQYFIIAMPAVLYLLNHWSSWLFLLSGSYYLQFVSQHNTSKYFNLSHLGFDLKYEWIAIGFAQIQILMALMLLVILRKKIKE